MELQFGTQEVQSLKCILSQVQNLEQTQELRLPEDIRDLGRILGCWGQVLIRSKSWQGDGVRVSGGSLVWLLCDGQEGTAPRRIETWIPFQMDWDLSAGCPEGEICVVPKLRFADARPVAAGKVLVRVGLGICIQCWVSQKSPVFAPGTVPEDVQLLRQSLPLRLPKEAGEKQFELEDQLTLPSSAPVPEHLLYYQMKPGVTDSKVMANKVVFRGNGNLHVLYESEAGQVHCWDFDLPFSQFAELKDSHSPDAAVMVTMVLTSLELECQEGTIRLKAGLTGQYLVEDRELVETVTDAWSPVRQVEEKHQPLELAAVLDSRREWIRGQENLPWTGDTLTDVQLLEDFPQQRRQGDQVILEQTGRIQLLGYDQEGKLQTLSHRLEGRQTLPADEAAAVQTVSLAGTVQTDLTAEGAAVRWEIPLEMRTMGGRDMMQLTALELGEKKEPDPNRPSLILRRAGQDRLWDLARASGSTVEAIREANSLTGEPEPGQMLLIPVL